MLGDSDADCIVGYAAADVLDGDADDDRLFGGAGDDELETGSGDDLAVGGGGNDTIVISSNSTDSTEGYGGAGDDVLEGGAGADTLYGEAGDDVLEGGAGADELDGGDGFDHISGGDGNDTIVADSICDLRSGELIDGGAGADTLETPFTSTELANMGVIVRNIETFTVLTSGGSDQCDGLSAPTGWSTSGGLSYRRITSEEMVRNNWLPGSYIVERGTGGLYYGQTTATVMLPTSSGTETRTLDRVVSGDSRSFGEVSYDSSVSHQSVTMSFDTFEEEDISGAYYGRVVVGDDDSLHGRVVDSNGDAFEIGQVQSHDWIDTSLASMPMSAGDAILVSPLGNGIPPGPGHKIPGTGVVIRFAYMGEGAWCMNNVDDWKADYYFDAQTVEAVHVNSDTGADMNFVFGTCHLFGSRDDAITCAATDPNGTIPSYCYDGSSHLYPFIGTKMEMADTMDAKAILDAVWDSADHAALHLTMPDIGLIQARTGLILYNPLTGHIVSGLATGANNNQNAGWLESLGASVAKGKGAGQSYIVSDLGSAHEFGHNFGGAHADAEELANEYTETIMWPELSPTLAPYFSDDNATTVESCVDLSYCPVGDEWTP